MLDRDRFQLLLPGEALEGRRVCVVGVGGIGSYVALWLGKMGVEEFVLVDPDAVEGVNVATQLYARDRVGWDKVAACKDMLIGVNPAVDVDARKKEFKGGDLCRTEGGVCDVVVASLDSLEVREYVAKAWMAATRYDRANTLLVDPRMGLEAFEVNLWESPVLSEHVEEWKVYRGSLQDTDAREDPCGAKAIAYTGGLCAAVVAAQVRRWLCGRDVPKVVMGHAGSGQLESFWREGEGYKEDAL